MYIVTNAHFSLEDLEQIAPGEEIGEFKFSTSHETMWARRVEQGFVVIRDAQDLEWRRAVLFTWDSADKTGYMTGIRQGDDVIPVLFSDRVMEELL